MSSRAKVAATLLVCFVLGGWAISQSFAAEPQTDEQKTLYALGMALAARVPAIDPTDAELEMIQAGVADRLQGKTPKVDMVTYSAQLDAFVKDRMAVVADKEKSAGIAFREKVAAEDGAVTAESGMIYLEETTGTGGQPGMSDTVKIHYHGTLADGSVFDSSVDRGEPAEFALNAVVPCFSEGIGRMKVGGKSKMVCPPELAYGDRGQGGIKPGATLVFEVELLEIVKPAAAVNPTP